MQHAVRHTIPSIPATFNSIRDRHRFCVTPMSFSDYSCIWTWNIHIQRSLMHLPCIYIVDASAIAPTMTLFLYLSRSHSRIWSPWLQWLSHAGRFPGSRIYNTLHWYTLRRNVIPRSVHWWCRNCICHIDLEPGIPSYDVQLQTRPLRIVYSATSTFCFKVPGCPIAWILILTYKSARFTRRTRSKRPGHFLWFPLRQDCSRHGLGWFLIFCGKTKYK